MRCAQSTIPSLGQPASVHGHGPASAHGGATESAGTTGGAVVSPNAPVSPLSFEEARRAALRRAEERAAMPRPLFGSFASDP